MRAAAVQRGELALGMGEIEIRTRRSGAFRCYDFETSTTL